MSVDAGMSAFIPATTATIISASDGIYASSGYNRSACTECQRRKQKCNREWPCDRCQRRKIADECRYSFLPNAHINYTNNPSSPTLTHSHLAGNSGPDSSPPLAVRTDGKSSAADAPSLDALAAARLFTTLGIESNVKPLKANAEEDYVTTDSSPQMVRVLDLLPQRQTMDKLITNFAQDVNYHYYINYPPDFLREYHIWWERRSKGKPITLQYTCLLAIVCACCVQHTSNSLQQELQQISGRSADNFTEHLHNAARELASVIPVGHYHKLNVQRLLHSCYWYKAEAKFVEAWHIPSAAILEGRELDKSFDGH